MPEQNIFENEFLISSADADYFQTLSYSGLINFLIQSAWKHAEILGFGTEFLHQNKLFWVLSRIFITIVKKPLWNNSLTVRTWPREIDRLFYLRDMEVIDASGELVAAATTRWLIVDIESKRPRLFRPDHPAFIVNSGKRALDKDDLSITFFTEDPEYFTRSAEFSDLDLNRHLTTTRYVDWMMDTFAIDYLEEHPVKNLQMNFMKEIPARTVVKITRTFDKENKTWYFRFSDESEAMQYFLGRMEAR